MPLPVRTIPPWVQDCYEDDLTPGPNSIAFPENPHTALVAQHNHSPSTTRGSETYGGVRSHNGEYPLSSGKTRSQPTSRWVSFARASAYPRENFNGQRITIDQLNALCGDQSQPWLAGRTNDDDEEGNGGYHKFRKERRVWYKRAQYTIMRHPFIPLVFRLIVFFFAMIALALGGSIYHITDDYNQDHRTTFQQTASTDMAIAVDAVAMVYTVYITYDEYFSKPLGLRSARAKVRIVLLDLFFIVFQAANLSLAFEGLSSAGQACKAGAFPGEQETDGGICQRQRALASVLLIALISWLLTFTVSIFRLVERIS